MLAYLEKPGLTDEILNLNVTGDFKDFVYQRVESNYKVCQV